MVAIQKKCAQRQTNQNPQVFHPEMRRCQSSASVGTPSVTTGRYATILCRRSGLGDSVCKIGTAIDAAYGAQWSPKAWPTEAEDDTPHLRVKDLGILVGLTRAHFFWMATIQESKTPKSTSWNTQVVEIPHFFRITPSSFNRTRT